MLAVTVTGYEPVALSEVPPVGTLYQFSVPPLPVAVSVTEPGPQRVTGLLVVGATGTGLTVTVTGSESVEQPLAVAVAV